MITPSRDQGTPDRGAQGARAFAAHAVLIAAVMALLFFSAGTFHYWQAWVFLSCYFLPSLAVTAWLVVKDPRLLKGRMRGGPAAERSLVQKIIMSIASLCFVGIIAIPALDHRLGWSQVPDAVVLFGDALVMIGWLAIFAVFRENSFAFSTIEVVEGQRVVSTGPYARLRHPMYAGGLVMLIGIPIALASWWGELALVAMMPALIWRLLDEEKFLAANLPGYADYIARVRYRLLPGLW